MFPVVCDTIHTLISLIEIGEILSSARLFIHTNTVRSNEFSSIVTSARQFLGADPLYSRETASRNFRGFHPPFSVYANEFGYVCDDRYEIGGTFVEGMLK